MWLCHIANIPQIDATDASHTRKSCARDTALRPDIQCKKSMAKAPMGTRMARHEMDHGVVNSGPPGQPRDAMK